MLAQELHLCWPIYWSPHPHNFAHADTRCKNYFTIHQLFAKTFKRQSRPQLKDATLKAFNGVGRWTIRSVLLFTASGCLRVQHSNSQSVCIHKCTRVHVCLRVCVCRMGGGITEGSFLSVSTMLDTIQSHFYWRHSPGRFPLLSCSRSVQYVPAGTANLCHICVHSSMLVRGCSRCSWDVFNNLEKDNWSRVTAQSKSLIWLRGNKTILIFDWRPDVNKTTNLQTIKWFWRVLCRSWTKVM